MFEKVDLQALEELDLLWSDAETHSEGVDVHGEEKFSQILEEVFSKKTKNKIVKNVIWNLWSTFWIRQRWFLSPFCNVAKLSVESHKCQNKFMIKKAYLILTKCVNVSDRQFLRFK